MKRITTVFVLLLSSVCLGISAALAATTVTFDDPAGWTRNDLTNYVGQTITLTQPLYICNNYNSAITVSLHRTMAETNQAIPESTEYYNLLTLNARNNVRLTGLSGYHRMGEKIYGATVRVNSTSELELVRYDHLTGTRADLEAGLPELDLVRDRLADTLVRHDLLVCCMNLEYYLVEAFGTGSSNTMGPANSDQHARQRAKTSAALAKIGADLYGIVEVQQGQKALQELADDLSANTGRHYTYIADRTSVNGTYTKSGYIYCSDVLKPVGAMVDNQAQVLNRKKVQKFALTDTGESLYFSVNHYKSKSASGNVPAAEQDKHDGQGAYNHTRVLETYSVLEDYQTYCGNEGSFLIMGDLNAYGMEDPIRILTNAGMTDLHRYFHADSSYSYTFYGAAGYLDHALCNDEMLAHVTGMAAYHINSDEDDDFTYNGRRSDLTMFRSSDHDPILVALKMRGCLHTRSEQLTKDDIKIAFADGIPVIEHANGGYYTLHSLHGELLAEGEITSDRFYVQQDHQDLHLPCQMYVINVYAYGQVKRAKYGFIR